MLLLSGVIVVGGVGFGIAAFKSNDHYGGYDVGNMEDSMQMDEVEGSYTE